MTRLLSLCLLFATSLLSLGQEPSPPIKLPPAEAKKEAPPMPKEAVDPAKELQKRLGLDDAAFKKLMADYAAALAKKKDLKLPAAMGVPKKSAPPKAFPNPAVPGGQVVLVPREQLRMKSGKSMAMPILHRARTALPPVPTVKVDWTLNGNTAIIPILGNDQYGDCYAAAACHLFSLMSANGQGVATADAFVQATLVAWYLKASGGDNGLGDSDVLPVMESGFIPGDTTTHKILDYLIVDPSNLSNIKIGMSKFGPMIWTCSLLTPWLSNMGPNANWDATGSPDPSAGHAMCLDSVTTDATNPTFTTVTWGYRNNLTYAGLKAAQPETILIFCLEWFNATGYTAAGDHISDVAPWWVAIGGSSSVLASVANYPPKNPVPIPTPPIPDPNPPAPTPPTPIPGPAPALSPTAFILDPSLFTFTGGSKWVVSGGIQSSTEARITADLTAVGADSRTISAIVNVFCTARDDWAASGRKSSPMKDIPKPQRKAEWRLPAAY